MQKLKLRQLFLGVAFLLSLTVAPAAVFAEGDSGTSGSGDENQTTTTTTTENETETENTTEGTHKGDLRKELEDFKTKREEDKQNKLDAVKEKVCENRKDNISNIMQRGIVRANRQIDLFGTIATRVEAFYVKKGKTLSNYDALVAAVNSAKTKAQTDIDTLKAQTTLDCTGADPKGQIEAFKTALKAVNQDLKDYRTAVKNLIVGVKSVQGTTSSSNEGSQQ